MDELRKKLNQIDDEILDLFFARMEISRQVGAYKRSKGIKVHDPAREEAILQRLGSKAPSHLKFAIRPLYKEIFALSRAIQITEGKTFGLVGSGLGHSLSPEIHRNFGYDYKLFDLDQKAFEDFIRDKDFDGINVTIPYKIKVMDYLDELDDLAKEIGSVNTVVNKDGRLIGYNTDYWGLKYTLDVNNICLKDKKVLVLGTGGASKTVQTLAKNTGARQIRLISRSGPYSYTNLEESRDFQILINASPIGMYPKNLLTRLDLGIFPDLEAVVDLVYNPLKTKLVLDAEKKSIPATGGLAMLVGQAYQAAKLFTQIDLPNYLVSDILFLLNSKMKNLVLVGMPGSGKTSLGKDLASKLGRTFVDTDQRIGALTGLDPEAYILERGLEAFRKVEEDLIFDLGKSQGLVIASGGGSILKESNRDALRQNSYVIYLARDLDKLATNNRPLSKDREAIAKLFEERKYFYESMADLRVDLVEGDPEKTLDMVLKGIRNEFTGN